MSSDTHSSGDSEPASLEDIPAEWYDAFRHPRRVRLLAVLGSSRTRLSLTELTTAIVENEPLECPTHRARDDVRISLRHNHLPRLADYGIVEVDDEDGVELVDEPPVAPTTLTSLLEVCERENCEQLLNALVHPVRFRVCSMVADYDRPLDLERLASELAARDIDALSNPERAALVLSHTHLPMLADAGVLEFDHESGRVTDRERAIPLVQ